MKGFLQWLVHWACRADTRDFVEPQLSPCMALPSKLGRQPCWVACLLYSMCLWYYLLQLHACYKMQHARCNFIIGNHIEVQMFTVILYCNVWLVFVWWTLSWNFRTIYWGQKLTLAQICRTGPSGYIRRRAGTTALCLLGSWIVIKFRNCKREWKKRVGQRPYLITFDATGSPCHELTSWDNSSSMSI